MSWSFLWSDLYWLKFDCIKSELVLTFAKHSLVLSQGQMGGGGDGLGRLLAIYVERTCLFWKLAVEILGSNTNPCGSCQICNYHGHQVEWTVLINKAYFSIYSCLPMNLTSVTPIRLFMHGPASKCIKTRKKIFIF